VYVTQQTNLLPPHTLCVKLTDQDEQYNNKTLNRYSTIDWTNDGDSKSNKYAKLSTQLLPTWKWSQVFEWSGEMWLDEVNWNVMVLHEDWQVVYSWWFRK